MFIADQHWVQTALVHTSNIVFPFSYSYNNINKQQPRTYNCNYLADSEYIMVRHRSEHQDLVKRPKSKPGVGFGLLVEQSDGITLGLRKL